MKQSSLIIISIFIIWSTTEAAQYYRCKDENGNTVFSQTPCDNNLKKESTQTYESGQKSLSVYDQLERLRSLSPRKGAPSKKPEKKDPCQDIRTRTLRNARVGKQIMKCHTKKDVLDMFGSPDSNSNWSDSTVYDTKWSYYLKDVTKFIYFKNNRVTEWSEYR